MPENVYERQWHLHGHHPEARISPGASLNIESFWLRHGEGSPEIVIAVADDGLDVAVPGLDGRDKLAGHAHHNGSRWCEFAPARETVRAKCPLGGTHGNAVAALIGAARGAGSGVAPGCRLFPVRLPMHGRRVVIDEEVFSGMLDIINRRADIALIPFTRFPTLHFSRRILDLMEQMGTSGGQRGKGVLFIFPAGNSNCPIHYQSPVPICYGLSGRAEMALRSRSFANVFTLLSAKLHVGAITASARKALYSCYGPGIDLCAPSSCERPFTREKAEPLPGLATIYRRDGAFTENFKGTSGAAALAAGVAALLRSRFAEASATEIVNMMKREASKVLDTADVYADPARSRWEDRPPAELSQGSFSSDGWSPWFGHGKVDASAF